MCPVEPVLLPDGDKDRSWGGLALSSFALAGLPSRQPRSHDPEGGDIPCLNRLRFAALAASNAPRTNSGSAPEEPARHTAWAPARAIGQQ